MKDAKNSEEMSFAYKVTLGVILSCFIGGFGYAWYIQANADEYLEKQDKLREDRIANDRLSDLISAFEFANSTIYIADRRGHTPVCYAIDSAPYRNAGVLQQDAGMIVACTPEIIERVEANENFMRRNGYNLIP